MDPTFFAFFLSYVQQKKHDFCDRIPEFVKIIMSIGETLFLIRLVCTRTRGGGMKVYLVDEGGGGV